MKRRPRLIGKSFHQHDNTMNNLLTLIEGILTGIDQTETDDNRGWWETSAAAKFGATKLEQIRALFKCQYLHASFENDWGRCPSPESTKEYILLASGESVRYCEHAANQIREAGHGLWLVSK
jgi:hypothetical protein